MGVRQLACKHILVKHFFHFLGQISYYPTGRLVGIQNFQPLKKHLPFETSEDLNYIFCCDDESQQQCLEFLISEFIEQLNKHKTDAYPLSLGSNINLQIWIVLLTQSLDKLLNPTKTKYYHSFWQLKTHLDPQH